MTSVQPRFIGNIMNNVTNINQGVQAGKEKYRTYRNVQVKVEGHSSGHRIGKDLLEKMIVGN